MRHNIAQRRNLDLLRVIDLTVTEAAIVLSAKLRKAKESIPEKELTELQWQLAHRSPNRATQN